MNTTKTRHQFYLPGGLSEKLDALAAKPGASKTSTLSDALTAWLDRQGAAEIDTRFGPRFDRLANAQARSDQKLDMLVETLGLFIRHQMTLVAHQPPFDPETVRLGSQRHQQFVEQVGRQLAKSQPRLDPPPRAEEAVDWSKFRP